MAAFIWSMIWKIQKNSNHVKYYCNCKILFSILIYLKCDLLLWCSIITSFQCYMILQKSFSYAHLVLFIAIVYYFQVENRFAANTFVETVTLPFKSKTLKNKQQYKKQINKQQTLFSQDALNRWKVLLWGMYFYCKVFSNSQILLAKTIYLTIYHSKHLMHVKPFANQCLSV